MTPLLGDEGFYGTIQRANTLYKRGFSKVQFWEVRAGPLLSTKVGWIEPINSQEFLIQFTQFPAWVGNIGARKGHQNIIDAIFIEIRFLEDFDFLRRAFLIVPFIISSCKSH